MFQKQKGKSDKMMSSLFSTGTSGLSGIGFSNIEIILIFATVIPFFTFVIAVLTSSSQSYYERKPVADGSGWRYIPRHRHLESMLHTLLPTFITAYKMLSVHLATCVVVFGLVFYGLIICGGCWLGIFEWNRQFGLHLVSEENVDTTSTFMYESTVGGSNILTDNGDVNADEDIEEHDDVASDSSSESDKTVPVVQSTDKTKDTITKPSPFVILKSFLIRELEPLVTPLAPIASALTSAAEIANNRSSTSNESTSKSNSVTKKTSSKKKTENSSENSINEALLATLQNIESRIAKIETS